MQRLYGYEVAKGIESEKPRSHTGVVLSAKPPSHAVIYFALSDDKTLFKVIELE